MTAKLAKEWFRAHPRSVVVFHWRWDKLPKGSRDTLAAPRSVQVVGNRAVFNSPTTGRSELSLMGADAAVDAKGDLVFTDPQGRHSISYMAVS